LQLDLSALRRDQILDEEKDMADQKTTGEPRTSEDKTTRSDKTQSSDPGRTPGTAEGDRETVEQDLRDKGRQK